MTMHAYAGLGAPQKTPELQVPEDDDTYTKILNYALNTAGGALVGRAIAPTKDDAFTYALIGAAVGGLTGPFGLGVFGIVSLNQRDELCLTRHLASTAHPEECQIQRACSAFLAV